MNLLSVYLEITNGGYTIFALFFPPFGFPIGDAAAISLPIFGCPPSVSSGY